MKSFNFFIILLFFSGKIFSKSTFKVGLLYPVNKNGVSYIGEEAVCISEGLLKEFSNKNVEISYKVYDTEQSENKTIVILPKIIKDKPDVVVGTTFSDPAIVASKMLSGEGIPFIVPTATNPKVTDGNNFTLRICYDDYVQAKKLAKFTNESIAPKKTLVLTNLSSEFSTFLSREYISNLKKTNPNYLVKEFKFIESSYNISKIIKELRGGGYDLIFSSLQASKTGLFYNELKRLSEKPVLLGSDSIGGRKSFFEIIKSTDNSIKFYFIRQWNKKFNGKYIDNYNKIHKKYCKGYEKTTMSVAAYDALKIVLQAIGRDSSLRKMALVNSIKGSKHEGLMGDIFFGERNTPYKKIYIYSIEKNKIKFVQEI